MNTTATSDFFTDANPTRPSGFSGIDRLQPITHQLPPEYVRLKNVELPPFLPNEGWHSHAKSLLIEALELRGAEHLIPAASEWFDQYVSTALIPFYQYERQRLTAHEARELLANAMLKAQMELPAEMEELDYDVFVEMLDDRLEEKRDDLKSRSRLGKGMIFAIGTLKTGLSLPFVTTLVQGLGLSWGPLTLILAVLLSVALGFVPALLWQTWYGLFEQTFEKKGAIRRVMQPGDTIYEDLIATSEPSGNVNIIGLAVLLMMITAILGIAGYAWVQVDAHTFEQLQKGLGIPMALTLTIGLFGAALAVAIQKHHLARQDHDLMRLRAGILERVAPNLLAVYRDGVAPERADGIITAMGWAVNRTTALTQWILSNDLRSAVAQKTLQTLLRQPRIPIPHGIEIGK